MDIILDIDRWLFGFQEEFSGSPNAETVVRRFGPSPDLDGVFVYHILVRLGVPLLIIYIPSERLEKRINEFATHLRLLIFSSFVVR